MPAPQPAAASSEVQEPKLSGYTIQLGAFDNPEQAQTVAAGLGVEGDIQIRQIISRGTTFSVILMGQYSSRADANAVAETLSINYWIRSLRSLVNAAVQ
jgi:septal ring-binding cell division protein DamX